MNPSISKRSNAAPEDDGAWPKHSGKKLVKSAPGESLSLDNRSPPKGSVRLPGTECLVFDSSLPPLLSPHTLKERINFSIPYFDGNLVAVIWIDDGASTTTVTRDFLRQTTCLARIGEFVLHAIQDKGCRLYLFGNIQDRPGAQGLAAPACLAQQPMPHTL